MWDLSDWFPLSSLDVTPTFVSFWCTRAAEYKQKLCMELSPELLCLFWQGQGSWLQAVSRQHYIFLPHNYCKLWFPLCRSCVTSINIKFHQPSPTRDFCTWRWFLFLVGAGQCVRGQCSFQWEKYRYELTSDPCALASTPFLQIVQLRKNERVDEGQG